MVNADGLHKKENYDQWLNQTYFSDKKLGYQTFKNATVLPHKDAKTADGGWTAGTGGVMDETGNFINGSYVFDNVSIPPYNLNEEIQYRNETAIYIGMLTDIWGNCLTDMFRKIWFLQSDYYKDYKNCPIVCVLYTESPLIKNVIDLLKVLEVDVSSIEIIKHPTKFKSVILPDSSFLREKPFFSYTNEYLQAIDKIKRHQQKIFTRLDQKKFYFDHSKLQGAGGADRLANYFQSKGYEILRPELFSFDDQLNIMANCENFAATVGSASFNTLFMRDHTEVLLMPRSASRGVNAYQSVINQIYDRNIFYVDTAFSLFASSHNVPYCYFISENLRKFFGDDTSERFTRDDYETFIQYSIYSRKKGLSMNEKEKDYYSDVLLEFFEGMKKNSDLLKKYNLIK